VRAVCEPYFNRPLSKLSLGQVLLRLFQTSRRFNVEIQPQLVLLQKTLLNIEGLGRDLDPDLDLWTTAKPYLERWMHQQIGWQGFIDNIKHEAPYFAKMVPQWPRLITRALEAAADQRDDGELIKQLLLATERQGRWIKSLALLLVLIAAIWGAELVYLLRH